MPLSQTKFTKLNLIINKYNLTNPQASINSERIL